MSSADSIELQTRRLDEAAVPPSARHIVPLSAVARIAAAMRHSGVARVLAVALAMGETHAAICRQERDGRQLGPRYMVRFPFTGDDVRRKLPTADLGEFDRHVETDELVKIIDGTPEEAGVVLPWPPPVQAARPWWKIW